MTTAVLYTKLQWMREQGAFNLQLADLNRNNPEIQVETALQSLRSYFPDGKIKLTGVTSFLPPDAGKRIEVTGTVDASLFKGMSVRLELWIEEKRPGNISELHLAVSAYSVTPGSRWTLGQAIPFYQGSLLGGLRFVLIDNDPSVLKYPFLTLSSHPAGDGAIPAFHCKGFVDVNSISAASPSLFVGDAAKDKCGLVVGTIAAFEPLGSGNGNVFRPYISLYSGLPDPPRNQGLGGLKADPSQEALFPLEHIRYGLIAEPDYNLATYDWKADCSFLWSADVKLKSANDPSRVYKIPIGAQVSHKGGKISFSSDLTEGIAFAWDALAGYFPGVPSSLPDTGFQLQHDIKLTKLELIADRTDGRGLKLDSISLNIQTHEDNRWVLIDRLLTLDAIDFFILVKNRPTGAPDVYVTLSGLVGIGEKAVLSLTGDVSHAGGQTDYGFSGELVSDEPIDIKEILTHFLGHSNYPAIPKLTIEDFSFSVRPRSKFYEGEIKISTDWELPGTKIKLHDVSFRMHHGAGEGDTTFEAYGVFEIGDVQIYVSADYVSNGQGWTFSGGTFDDEEIPIGTWISDVWKLWTPARTPPLPAALNELVLLNLGVRINTTTRDFSFQGTARFPKDGTAELTVQVNREGDTATFRGVLTLFRRNFEVAFSNAGLLVATYDGSSVEPVDLKELVSAFSPTLGAQMAAGISINLTHAHLAYSSGTPSGKFLFGVELDAGIQLSNLPVVGFLFERSQTLNVVFQLLAVTRAFEVNEIQAINQLSGPEMAKLPEEKIGGVNPGDADFRLKVAVRFAGVTQQLALPVKTDVHTPQPTKKLPVSSNAGNATYWAKIDRALGPFHFQRLGISTDGTNLSFLLDAGLKTAGLTITLDSLEAKCKFADLSKGEFHPTFNLKGLGIAFKRGDLEIGGALVHRPPPAINAFDGAVVIHYKRLGIEAVGSYEEVDGHPALFIYALIDYPLGGPSFFYVEGGALGFGYNRTIQMPTIDKVSEFPLVKQALAPSASRLKPMEMAGELRDHITPVAGQYFIAVGIKFTSFKTIKGFVLLTVLFGDHFEIDVLGKATLTSPPEVESSKALMSATLVLLGRFLPEEGLLMIMAQLAPDAHLFAPDCHLTGGFALCCWFNGPNKGDFVLTLGGYHKAFRVPPHYPQVPRLGMNWQVNENLSLKAEAYFALTPSALMAGGKLEANWKSGNLQAWFRAEVDFLIGWKPFYYSGHALVAIGARYRFDFFGSHEISAELTAELDVWGPPFSGRARIQWSLISFEVKFGDPNPKPPDPLDWTTFRKSFLPLGRMFTVTAEGGTVTQADAKSKGEGNLGFVNPRTLCIAVRSPLPVKKEGDGLLKKAIESSTKPPIRNLPKLGIAPMNRTAAQWESNVTIVISHEKSANTKDDISTLFQATRIRDNVPVSLWGEKMNPKDRGQDELQLVEDAICGYEIRPLSPIKPTGSTGFSVVRKPRPIQVRRPQPAIVIDKTHFDEIAKKMAENLLSSDVEKRRRDILNHLLPEIDSNWGTVTIASWRGSPKIVKSRDEAVPDEENPWLTNIT